jgi:hypothetical protein
MFNWIKNLLDKVENTNKEPTLLSSVMLDMEKTIVLTNDEVANVTVPAEVSITKPKKVTRVQLDKMSKIEIDSIAKEKFGVGISFRKTKENMIVEFLKLQKETK